MKDYYNDGSNNFVLQNQFTAFVQTAVRRTRTRYVHSLLRFQNNEIVGLLEKGAFPGDDGESAFFYAASNNDDFWDSCDLNISVGEILHQLSDQEQRILKLHVFDDLPFTVIAAVLHKNANTVKAIYYHAIKKLAALLGDENTWDF